MDGGMKWMFVMFSLTLQKNNSVLITITTILLRIYISSSLITHSHAIHVDSILHRFSGDTALSTRSYTPFCRCCVATPFFTFTSLGAMYENLCMVLPTLAETICFRSMGVGPGDLSLLHDQFSSSSLKKMERWGRMVWCSAEMACETLDMHVTKIPSRQKGVSRTWMFLVILKGTGSEHSTFPLPSKSG